MSDLLPQLGLVAVLVVINAAFAGTEMALVSLRDGQLQRLEATSRTGAALAQIARQPTQYLATIQIGITMAGFLASAAAAVSLAEPLEQPLGFLGGGARPISIVVVTLLLSYVTLVLGELAPKRVAMQRAERWAIVMTVPLALLMRATRPAVWFLSRSTDVAVRLLGADPDGQRAEVTEDELRDMVAAQTTITPEQRLVIDGAFEIAQRTLDEVLVPRGDVYVIDADSPCPDALRELNETGFSRAPVAPGRNLDDVIGWVHLRQLLDADDVPVSTIAAELPAFPGAAPVLSTLRQMQTVRVHLALVVNEHGGADGIVTMEDLIEELVGEIYDETDPDVVTATHEPDGAIVLPGRFPVHDLPDIGIDLPAGDYTTVAGLVLERLGHIPTIDDHLDIGQWHIEIRAVSHRTITQVAIRPLSVDGAVEDGLDPLPSELDAT